MSTQPEALRLADALEGSGWREVYPPQVAAELRRLLSEALRIEGLAYQQHTEIYGLRLQVVNDTIESQGTLR